MLHAVPHSWFPSPAASAHTKSSDVFFLFVHTSAQWNHVLVQVWLNRTRSRLLHGDCGSVGVALLLTRVHTLLLNVVVWRRGSVILLPSSAYQSRNYTPRWKYRTLLKRALIMAKKCGSLAVIVCAWREAAIIHALWRRIFIWRRPARPKSAVRIIMMTQIWLWNVANADLHRILISNLDFLQI